MEYVDKVNLERLEWCCDEAELSLPELFKQLKISDKKAEKLSNGETEDVITFKDLEKLGKFFDRGMLFFYGEGAVNDDALLSPQYRTMQNQKPHVSYTIKKLIRRVEKHREIYLGLVEELDWDMPVTVEYPTIPEKASHQSKAEILRKWLGLGPTNTFDSYRRAIEDKGILVIVTNGYKGNWQIPKTSSIRGFALFYDVLPVIVVKKITGCPEAQSFTLMHELAHLVLHQDSFIDDEDDLHGATGREKEANVVAGCLLVPDRFLEPFKQSALANLAIDEFRGYFKDYVKDWAVSVDVILIRLVNIGKIAYTAYDAYRRWSARQIPADKGGGSRAYRNREPVHILGKPYVGAVLTALGENTITLTKASKFLDDIKLTDIYKLKESYARM